MKKADNERRTRDLPFFLRDPCEGEFPDHGFRRLSKRLWKNRKNRRASRISGSFALPYPCFALCSTILLDRVLKISTQRNEGIITTSRGANQLFNVELIPSSGVEHAEEIELPAIVGGIEPLSKHGNSITLPIHRQLSTLYIHIHAFLYVQRSMYRRFCGYIPTSGIFPSVCI